jgi:HTH-type transcriptional regulator/antitoxin HigA
MTKIDGGDESMHNSLKIIKAEQAWTPIADFIYVPHDEKEYDQLVNFLDDLIDEVGEDETHPLAAMMEILGVLIEHYERNHVPELTSN